MRKLATSALAFLLTTAAASADDIVLRGMGSLHVGVLGQTCRTPNVLGKAVFV